MFILTAYKIDFSRMTITNINDKVNYPIID